MLKKFIFTFLLMGLCAIPACAMREIHYTAGFPTAVSSNGGPASAIIKTSNNIPVRNYNNNTVYRTGVNSYYHRPYARPYSRTYIRPYIVRSNNQPPVIVNNYIGGQSKNENVENISREPRTYTRDGITYYN